MGRKVGIDFGTTNSVVAVLTAGEPEVLANAEGTRTTPSVVAFGTSGETIVGTVAKRQAVTNVARTVSSVKRHFGDSSWGLDVDGHRYTAPEIAARILSKLKKDAETFLSEPVTSAVITVPAYFNDAQRQAVKDAGRVAGLQVERIVNEPTAAALAYGLDKSADQTVLVFDLGGGTFDVSVLEIGAGVIEVRATSGDNRLGGDDWDRRLADWLLAEVKGEFGLDISADPAALARLVEAAEHAKVELSAAQSTTISLPYIAVDATGKPLHLVRDVTRAMFEDMTADLLARCRVPFTQALADAGFAASDIDHVVMVGGSTRMPAVAALVKQLTGGREPHRGVNPDEVVAAGAALQGGVLSGEVKSVLLLDVTPLSLGIEAGSGQLVTLIPRNTTIPARKSETFTTAVDGQSSVSIQVYQGERPIAARNKKLGVFELTNLPPAPRGVPKIEVTFDIDVNGIVKVSAKDLATGREQQLAVTGGSGLSQAEIDAMIADAAQHEKDDEERRQVLAARDAASAAIRQAEVFLAEYSAQLAAGAEESIRSAVAATREAQSSEDTGVLESSTAKLSAETQRAGASLYGVQEAAASAQDPHVDPGTASGEVLDSQPQQQFDSGAYPAAGDQNIPPPPPWATR